MLLLSNFFCPLIIFSFHSYLALPSCPLPHPVSTFRTQHSSAHHPLVPNSTHTTHLAPLLQVAPRNMVSLTRDAAAHVALGQAPPAEPQVVAAAFSSSGDTLVTVDIAPSTGRHEGGVRARE